MKTSLGIWAFGSMVTRFVPAGYKPELANQTTSERVRRAVEGLGDLMDGYEIPLPARAERGEPRRGERGARRARASTASRQASISTSGSEEVALISPDAATRGEAVKRTLDAIDFAGRARRPLHHLARDRGLQLPVPDAVRGELGLVRRRNRPRRPSAAGSAESCSSSSTRTRSRR